MRMPCTSLVSHPAHTLCTAEHTASSTRAMRTVNMQEAAGAGTHWVCRIHALCICRGTEWRPGSLPHTTPEPSHVHGVLSLGPDHSTPAGNPHLSCHRSSVSCLMQCRNAWNAASARHAHVHSDAVPVLDWLYDAEDTARTCRWARCQRCQQSRCVAACEILWTARTTWCTSQWGPGTRLAAYSGLL